MNDENKKECPMIHLRCTNCEGFVADGMKCRWGYKRTYLPPDDSQKHVKRVEPKSRW